MKHYRKISFSTRLLTFILSIAMIMTMIPIGSIINVTAEGEPEMVESPEESLSEEPEASPLEEPEASPLEEPEASPLEEPEVSPSASPETSPAATPEASPSASPEASPAATPKIITIADIEIEDKTYDGNNSARFSVEPHFEDGDIEDEDIGKVELVHNEPAFTNVNVGEDILIEVEFELVGESAGKYKIDEGSTSDIKANIIKKILTVKATDKVITYGAELLFDVEVEGFVEGEEEEESLAEEIALGGMPLEDYYPKASCNATSFSMAGTYDITLSGGTELRNYSFDCQNGILTINNAELIQGTHYEVSGDTVNGNGWLTGDELIITPKTGSYSGYTEISKDNENWDSELKISDESNVNKTFYLKDSSTGAVSEIGEIAYKRDKTKPYALEISYKTSLLSRIINVITFGYYKPSVTIGIKAEDNISGVEYFDWSYTREAGSSTVNVGSESGHIDSGEINYSDNGKTAYAEFTLTADEFKQYRGNISFTATDAAGNTSDNFADGENNIIVDTKVPQVEISYSGNLIYCLNDRGETVEADMVPDGDTIYVYDGNIIVTVEVTDANFVPNDSKGGDEYNAEDITITVKDGYNRDDDVYDYLLDYTKNDWTKESEDKWKLEFTLEDAGMHVVQIDYKDRSQNDMEWESEEYENVYKRGGGTYISNNLMIKDNPTIEVEYEPEPAPYKDSIYASERIAKISIKDANFKINILKSLDISIEDIDGTPANVSLEGLDDWNNWDYHNNNVWQTEINFNEDAHYNFNLSYNDADASDFENDFIIDKTLPENLSISYQIAEPGFLEKIIETISGGKLRFYKPSVKVTLKADDATAGIDCFEWKYTREDGSHVVNSIESDGIIYSNDGKTATASFTLPIEELGTEYRGNISFKAFDKAGNSESLADEDNTIIIDTIAPKADINYPDPTYRVDTDTGSVFYYGESPTVTLEIEEANFDPNSDALSIKVNNEPVVITSWVSLGDKHTADITISDDGDYIITVEYTDHSGNEMPIYTSEQITVDTTSTTRKITYPTPKGIVKEDGLVDIAENLGDYVNEENTGSIFFYDNSLTAKIVIDEVNFNPNSEDISVKVNNEPIEITGWTSVGDEHTAEITLSGEGDYIITVDYIDYSGNEMPTYTSEKITIDMTDPIIDVLYSSDRYTTINGIPCYNEPLISTITVTEHNFRADGIDARLIARDIAGTNMDVELVGSINDYLRNEDNWTHNGDIHTVTLNYDEDANYSFDVDYTDLAYRKSAERESDYFIIDQTAPENLSVSYEVVEPSIWEKIIETISGGKLRFYKPSVKVTLKAEDETAGVDYFEWIYIGEDGSNFANVNLIESGDIAYSNYGKTASASFILPIDATVTEYRGNISFKAVDKAGNSESLNDEKNTIIIDTVAPKINITYPDPTRIAETGDVFYYDESLTATLEIEEANFDPDSQDLSIKVNGESITIASWISAGDKHTAEITLSEDGDYIITVEYTDHSGNEMQPYTSEQIIVDTTSPTRTITYPAPKRIVKKDNLEDIAGNLGDYVNEENTGSIFFYDNSLTAKIVIDEVNFNPNSADISVKVNNEPIEITGWTSVGDKHTAEITLSGEGDYIITVDYTDYSGNEMPAYTSEQITIDMTDPIIDVLYSSYRYTTINGVPCYDEPLISTITVTEHNFRADGIDARLTARDIAGTNIDVELLDSINDYLRNKDNWTHNGDSHTVTLTYDEDANYSLDIDYTDLAYRKSAERESDYFTLDQTTPENLSISYEVVEPSFWEKIIENISGGKLRFYNPSVKVILTAEDIISGVDYFEWNYTKEVNSSNKNAESNGANRISAATYSSDGKTASASFTLPIEEIGSEYRGNISFTAFDKAGYSTMFEDPDTVIVDTIAPTRSITYPTPKRIVKKDDLTDVAEDAGDYVNGENTGSIFFYADSLTAKLVIDEANFDPDSDSETLSVKVNNEPIAITGWDSSDDKHTAYITLSGEGDYIVTVEYTDHSNNKMQSYTSEQITIDMTDPIIDIAYDTDRYESIDELSFYNFYNQTLISTITVTEHNFRADGIAASLTAQDIEETDIDVELVGSINEYLRDENNWTHNGDTHTAKLNYDEDANYSFDISYTDLAYRKSAERESDNFTVDKTAPENLSISYEVVEPRFWEKIIENISGGKLRFYNPSVKVILTAEDIISGVNYFDWEYIKEKGSSAVNADSIEPKSTQYSGDGKRASLSVILPIEELGGESQYRGSISFKALDKAGNAQSLNDVENTIVIDTITPTRTITYSAPKRIVKKDGLTDVTGDLGNYANQESTDTIFYYDKNVTATLVIEEANFDAKSENLSIKVNNVPASIEKWNADGDKHTAEIIISGDGDYVLTVDYTDHSDNKMHSYTSEQITIDTKVPIIAVSYGSNRKAVIDGITYYDKAQTMTISVTEHNFRADDVAATVTAKDIAGNNIPVSVTESVNGYLKNRKNWTKNGDTHTATLSYNIDANYTFNIDYVDMAMHKSAPRPTEYFTIDTVEPKNLEISYSQSLIERIIETVTFGYYNAHMTVNIKAVDDISGIYSFKYNGHSGAGVSSVNADILETAVEKANIKYSDGGKVASASFDVPKAALNRDSQFNGTIEFVAYDRSENYNSMADKRRIVVDNIAPGAAVTYNTPYQTANGVAYYAGDINASIEITEANFFKEDVNVTINRDGTQSQAAVSWSERNVDQHVGTFTLSAEGDYTVSVTYKDSSGNVMADYKSSQMTVDTVSPQIIMEGISNESANNGETIGFKINASDVNFDTAGFKTVFTAVIRDENGSFKTDTITNGAMRTVSTGKEYSYVIDNLDTDGIYALSCTVSDLSGNSSSEIVVSDSGGAGMQEVVFSVNRNGSAFMLDDNTNGLISNYYVQNVANDVVFIETNTDPLTHHKIIVNGLELNETEDYNVSHNGGGEKWNKYTYSIDKTLFESEGEYNVTVSSKDKAGNDAYSDIKSAEVNYVVDRTPPVVTVSGLKADGLYKVESQSVTIVPKDDGGKLNNLKVIVTEGNGTPIKDKNGEDISVRLDLSGEELFDALEIGDGTVTFDIPSRFNSQNIQIICGDYAGNVYDSNRPDKDDPSAKPTYRNIIVSTNNLAILLANKGLLVGIVSGGVIVIAAATVGVSKTVRKRKKRLL